MTITIAFHGLGVMGLNMATRLLQAGFTVYGHDVDESRLAEFAARGGKSGDDGGAAEVVIMMLPKASVIEDVTRRYCVDASRRNAILFLDCSTTEIGTTRRLAEMAAAKGHAFVDAPVSGGYEMAERGEISFMVGGTDAAVERAAPLFKAMGKRYLHFGEVSSGQAVKACNNMVIGISMMALAEGFALADRLGLDQRKVLDLWLNAGVRSWLLENRCPAPGLLPDVPSSNGYAPGFASELMVKDLQLAQDAAATAGIKVPFGANALKAYEAFVAQGNGALDFSAIYKTYS